MQECGLKVETVLPKNGRGPRHFLESWPVGTKQLLVEGEASVLVSRVAKKVLTPRRIFEIFVILPRGFPLLCSLSSFFLVDDHVDKNHAAREVFRVGSRHATNNTVKAEETRRFRPRTLGFLTIFRHNRGICSACQLNNQNEVSHWVQFLGLYIIINLSFTIFISEYSHKPTTSRTSTQPPPPISWFPQTTRAQLSTTPPTTKLDTQGMVARSDASHPYKSQRVVITRQMARVDLSLSRLGRYR
eukprot:scaffold370_cov176-Amphora_coffeaeformis.AAC.23